MMEQFLEQCLSEVGEKSFHSTMTKSDITTVGDIQEKEQPLGIGYCVSLNTIVSPDLMFICALAEFWDDVTVDTVLSQTGCFF